MDLSFLDDPHFGQPQSFGGHDFMIPSFKSLCTENQKDLTPKLSGGQLQSEGFCFKLANTQDPHNFVKYMKEDHATKAMTDFKKGTTTLAFEFNGGVIVAVDSRATMGALISSHTVRKVIQINDFLLGTMAGGAADCSFWERDLARQCRLFELRNNERITVAGASKLLSSIFYHYRGYGLSCGTMVAGSDTNGKASLFYVDDKANRLRGQMFSVGSGSTYAYGVLDAFYDWNMSLQDAIDLSIRAISSATFRDAGSGGVVRVYHVHDKGWTKIHDRIDVSQLHYQYNQSKGLRGDGKQVAPPFSE